MAACRPPFALLALLAAMSVLAQVDSPPPPLDTDTVTVVEEPDMVQPEATPVVDNDTVPWRQRHSPKRASLLSAVLPGAGQIYNRKYWKAPMVWAGLGTCVWFIQDNTREYQRYRKAYIALVDDDPDTIDEFEGQYSPAQVLEVTDTYRRWRDLSYIACGLVYMLNVVDASVDAHFVRFDVSPELSMGLGPSWSTLAQGAPGLSLSLAIR